MKKYILYTLLLLLVLPASAQHLGNPDEPFTLSTLINNMGNTLLYIILGIAVIMLVLVTAVYYAVVGMHHKILAEKDSSYLPLANQGFWERLFQVKPMSEEKEQLLDHNYDGIQELSNPIPAWFMWLFYVTVAFGIVYLLNYHVLGTYKLQDDEYVAEVEQAQVSYNNYLKSVGDKINANTVTLLVDKTQIATGGELFAKNCVACHGKMAEGTQIAPNLTDEFWKNGGGVKNIFKVITEGVELKGMKSWKKDFSPIQIQQLSSYIISLQGSNPPNAKEPEGEKWSETPATSPQDSTSATKPDSVGASQTTLR